MSSAPLITFVIATYKRVDALKCTLQSLVLQDYQNWEALVIGDCCEDETAEVVQSFQDPRLKYYNLPERFGEQSGANTFGLYLAQGEFMTFLNHDDLLLSDHLDYALQQINSKQADFYLGLCAHASELIFKNKETVIPVFTSILPKYRNLNYLITRNSYLFDPSSFWLIKTSYAKKVGDWKMSNAIWRTPLRDWIMRAWRLGGKFIFSDRVTGLRFWTQNVRKGDYLYSNKTPEHSYMIKMCQTQSPKQIRQFIFKQIKESQQQKKPLISFLRQVRSIMHWFLIHTTWKTMTLLYLWFGLDYLSFFSKILKRPKGGLHKFLIQKRTGEKIIKMPDVERFLVEPEKMRIL